MLSISDMFDDKAMQELHALVATLGWRDGAETAGHAARMVKRNLQADLSTRNGARLVAMIENAICSHPVVIAATQPRSFARFVISKTVTGGGYGLHVDNLFMAGQQGEIRTDVSFTVFLSNPEEYEGGELAIEHAGISQNVKLPLGDMVLYPATSLHSVTPVIKGERIVCVGWIESRVKNAADREILFDLENLRASLARHHAQDSVEMLTVSKVIANLLRRFS